jgi:DNA-binding NarL/FixJ family response regulator
LKKTVRGAPLHEPTYQMPTLNLVILARIPLIREGLRAMLAEESDLRVTLLAPTDDWLEDLQADEPDALLLDVQVLEREGWTMLQELSRAIPELTIIILGDDANDRRVARALEMGARGYLLPDVQAREIADAIRAAHSGAITLNPRIAASLLQALRESKSARDDGDPPDDELIEPLTERELEVLRLMTRGMPNKQIAAQLFITEHTVKFHIRSILGKLGATNRTEAVTLGLQKGLVSL